MTNEERSLLRHDEVEMLKWAESQERIGHDDSYRSDVPELLLRLATTRAGERELLEALEAMFLALDMLRDGHGLANSQIAHACLLRMNVIAKRGAVESQSVSDSEDKP
jgi:hypothetical protein